LELLPPKIADTDLFSLILEVLASRQVDLADLRVRLMGVSTQALVHLANDQGVLFPFIWALKSRSLLIPLPSARDDTALHSHPTFQMEAAYYQHLERRRAQRDQLMEALWALNNTGVVPLLLKGARYLMSPVGPWCEARDMRDLDLLVKTSEADTVSNALQALKYRFQEDFGPIDQHLPELCCASKPSAIEIHTHSLPFTARIFLDTEEVWQHAVQISAEQVRYCVLPNHWQLLHCLLNHQVADHGYRRRTLAVKGLWEFTMLGATLSEESWKSIVDHLDQHRQLNLLASWALQADHLFGLSYPRWIKISTGARVQVNTTFARATAPNWWRRVIFVIDQFRFGFARRTLATRYQLNEADVSLGTVVKHVRFLARRYRGKRLQRLTGGR
jgi:hypothetical protein